MNDIYIYIMDIYNRCMGINEESCSDLFTEGSVLRGSFLDPKHLSLRRDPCLPAPPGVRTSCGVDRVPPAPLHMPWEKDRH